MLRTNVQGLAAHPPLAALVRVHGGFRDKWQLRILFFYLLLLLNYYYFVVFERHTLAEPNYSRSVRPAHRFSLHTPSLFRKLREFAVSGNSVVVLYYIMDFV